MGDIKQDFFDRVEHLQKFVEQRIKTINEAKDDLFFLQDQIGKLKLMYPQTPCPLAIPDENFIFPPQSTGVLGAEYISPVSLPSLDGDSVIDPNTGVNIRRLLSGVRHEYSERLAINLDNTRYISNASKVYNLQTLSQTHDLAALAGISSEAFFSSTKPDLVIGAGGGELKLFDLSSGQIYNTGIPAYGFGPFETGASFGDLVLVSSSQAAGVMRLVDVSDPNNPQIIATATEPSGRDASHVSTDGNFAVVAHPAGATIYDSNLVAQRTVPYSGHGAVAVDSAGNQVYVVTSSTAQLRVFVLSDNSGNSDYILGLNNIQGASHLSGNSCDRPGYIYGSFNTDFSNADGDNTAGFIGAIKLEPNSQTYEVWSSYWFQNHIYENTPKAGVSKDGRSIIFTTPVGGGGATDYLLSV